MFIFISDISVAFTWERLSAILCDELENYFKITAMPYTNFWNDLTTEK